MQKRRESDASQDRAALEVVVGIQAGQVFGLRERDYTVGRGRDCDIVLVDRAVSRLHARVRFEGARFVIEDADSAHGVFLDANRVHRADLRTGSLLGIGGLILRFQVLDAEGSTTSSHVPLSHATDPRARGAAVAALDRLRIGVVLVDAESRVVLANRTADAILAAGDGLVIERGVLRATDAAASRQLARVVRDAPPGGALALPREPPRRPLTVMITPLTHRTRPVGGPVAAHAVFVSDPDRGLETSEQLLARLYQLTPTEARVTTLLAQGLNLEQVSEELGVAVATSRSHLKSIFQKTECRRQSDLVRLLLAGPALLDED